MSPGLTTFLFETANFLVLFAALAWLFFKPVRKALSDQQAQAVAQAEAAAHKLAEAENLQAVITTQRQQLAVELEQLRAQARDAAKQEAATILSEGQAQLERERAIFRRAALTIEKAQTTKIAHAVATATHATVKRFFEQMEGPETEHMLLKAACRELQSFSNSSLAPVTIESAVPLAEAAQQCLAAALGVAQHTADFRIVPELTAGVRIATAQGLIDATVAGLASFAEQALFNEIEAILREESAHA